MCWWLHEQRVGRKQSRPGKDAYGVLLEREPERLDCGETRRRGFEIMHGKVGENVLSTEEVVEGLVVRVARGPLWRMACM
jgi:hypothetical protein